MQKIRINLSTRHYPGKVTGIALPLFIVILSTFVYIYMGGMIKEEKARIARTKNLVKTISGRISVKPASATPVAKFDRAGIKMIMEQRNFHWISALDNIEKTIPEGVSLNSVEPNFEKGVANVTGFARKFGSISVFIDNLAGLETYKRIYLENQSIKEINEEKNAIFFTLTIEGIR